MYTELWVDSHDLSAGSSVEVKAICDRCGAERILRRNQYSDLCGACYAASDDNHERLRRMSQKRWSDELQHEKARERMLFRMHDPDERKHMDELRYAPDVVEQALRNTKRGSDHPRWNPNRTEVDRVRERLFPEYYSWRTSVFRRDDWTCQACGQRGGHLNAHHLASWSKFPLLRLDVANGTTLCESCHDEFHLIYGKHKGNTPEQFREFVESKKCEEVTTNESEQHQASA